MTEASIIYGLHAVRRAIESGQAGHLYVRRGKRSSRIDEVLALCAADQVLEWVDEARLYALTGTDRHQGMVFESVERQAPTVSLDALMMAKEGRRLLLALDGVTDPGNLGACLRSAATFGVDGVIVPKHGSAPVNAIVHKRSAGAAASLPLLAVTNLARTLRQLKEAGYWVVGTAMDAAARSIDEVGLTGNLVLVMGSEGEGIRRNVRNQCDELVMIPMIDTSYTLNVSVAAGICLYEINRQHQQEPRR